MTWTIHFAGAEGSIGDPKEFFSCMSTITAKTFDDPVDPQALSANCVMGSDHIHSAFEHAIRSFSNKTNRARSIGFETFLYLTGERQIKNAISLAGVKEGEQKLCLFFILGAAEDDTTPVSDADSAIDKTLEELGLHRNDSLLELSDEKLRWIGVSDEEIRTAGSINIY